MQEKLKELIKILKTGTPLQVKTADKGIEKLYDNLCQNYDEKCLFWEIFINELKNMHDLDDKHKASLIYSLKRPVMFAEEEFFCDIIDVVFQNIQSNSGLVRQAVINLADNFFINISCITDFKNPGTERNQKAGDYFGYLAYGMALLQRKYYAPKFNKYKYTSSMPPSVYKSVGIIFSNIFYNKRYDIVYEEFLNKTPKYVDLSRIEDLRKEVMRLDLLEKRKEIKRDITALFKKLEIKISFEELKKKLYNHNRLPDLIKDIKITTCFKDINETNKAFMLISNLWNHFPHKILNGLCPFEKLHEFKL
ncbi:MAG: hypothetical protein L6420_09065 [Elusimicrobia bacterium]|nr:hypothetical protein [Elusimicrobiota bacterium]